MARSAQEGPGTTTAAALQTKRLPAWLLLHLPAASLFASARNMPSLIPVTGASVLSRALPFCMCEQFSASAEAKSSKFIEFMEHCRAAGLLMATGSHNTAHDDMSVKILPQQAIASWKVWKTIQGLLSSELLVHHGMLHSKLTHQVRA